MTKNDPKSVTYLPVEEEFLNFSVFLPFHSKWLRKLEMKCRLKGLRWKDQLFQQRYVDFLATTVGLSLPTETYSVWYYSLGQKVFRSLHFLTHRRPTLRIWRHIDSSPHPSLVKDVQSGAKMFQLHFNIVFFGGKGEVCWVNSALQGCILKLDIQRGAYVLPLLSKIVDFPIIYCFLCLMVAPTTSDHQLHHYFLSLKSQELFSTLQLQYLFKIISVAIRNIQDHNKFCCSVKKLNVIQH